MQGGIQVYLHSFLNLALDGGEGSISRFGRFIPGGHLRLGGPQSQSRRFGEENNFLPLVGIRTRTVQPARLTDTFYTG